MHSHNNKKNIKRSHSIPNVSQNQNDYFMDDNDDDDQNNHHNHNHHHHSKHEHLNHNTSRDYVD